MKLKHAVLEDKGISTRFVTVADGLPRKPVASYMPTTYQHASSLWETCQRLGVTHVWIMPESMPERMSYNFFSPVDGYSIFVPKMFEEKRAEFPRGGRIWKENAGGFEVKTFFANQEPWSFGVTGHLELLSAVEYASCVLPVPVEWSQQAIGRALLALHYSQTLALQKYLYPPVTNLAELPFKQCDRDVDWKGQILPFMAEGYTFHLFDENSAHPAAARNMITGCGDPVHVTGAVEPNLPGIYRVTWHSQGSKFDGARLPLVIERNRQWVTQPVLKFAVNNGYRVQVHEAYVFELRHRLFKGWVDDLWQARVALRDATTYTYKPGRDLAELLIKEVMNHTISAMRLNWMVDMWGQSRVRRLVHLSNFAVKGHYPVLIFRDGIGFMSREKDPRKAFTDVLAREGELGGYKHVYSVECTRDMIEQAMSAKKGQDCLKVFHARARELGLR